MVFSTNKQIKYKKYNINKQKIKKVIGIILLTFSMLTLFITIPILFFFKFGGKLDIFNKWSYPKDLLIFAKQDFFLINGMAEIIILLSAIFLIFFIIGVILITISKKE